MATNTAPTVSVISYHNGSTVRDMQGNKPSDLATAMDLSLAGVAIYVDDVEAKDSTQLRDGHFVSFQKNKVSSGSK